MSWDYRFVQVEVQDWTCLTTTEVGLYEVYYDEAGKPISRTVEPATIVGDTLEDAASALLAATDALRKPLLLDEEIGS